jgi:hypothetical protein
LQHSEAFRMTCQFSKPEKAILAGALMLGSVLPARAQSPMLFQVGDAKTGVVGQHVGKGAQLALYHLNDPSKCIGVYDPAAVAKGGDAITPAGLKNAAELQALLDATPLINGQHYLQLSLYKGAKVELGVCDIGQSAANYTAAATQSVAPAQSPQEAVAAQMNALMNSVRLQVNAIEADAKKATIKITDSHNNNYVMKIEPANALQAIGSTYRQGLRGSSASAGDGFSGKDYKVSINGSFARFYKPDGTPEEAKEDRSNLGSGTTSAVMREWNGSDLKAIADAVTEKVKASTGKEPDYANVLRSLSNKETGAPPSTFVPASGGHP